jgi:hypothetical protein
MTNANFHLMQPSEPQYHDTDYTNEVYGDASLLGRNDISYSEHTGYMAELKSASLTPDDPFKNL